MGFLRNIRIGRKLFILTAIAVIALAIVSGVGTYYMRDMAGNAKDMYNEQLIPNDTFNAIQLKNQENDTYILELMITEDEERNQELMDSLETSITEINDLVSQVEDVKLSPESTEIFQTYVQERAELSSLRSDVLRLATINQNQEAYELYLSEYQPLLTSVIDQLASIAEHNTQFAEETYQNAIKDSQRATIIVVAISILALILLIAISWLITKMIVTPLRQTQTLLAKAAEGDFSEQGSYQSKDEIGQLMLSFNAMSDSMRSMIKTVNDSAQQVAASSEELSASAEQSSSTSEHITMTMQDLSESASDQLHMVKENGTTIAQMKQQTNQIEQYTQSVEENVGTAAENSAEGSVAIGQVQAQMDTINKQVTGLAEAVQGLNDRSNQIEEIVTVITNIAAQTNLLALNAAIEAARAGEHGQGFAVVADEVRELAEQSRQSAEEITAIIGHIQQDTAATITKMEAASTEVTAGNKVVGQAGTAFTNIEASIQDVRTAFTEVRSALALVVTGADNVKGANDKVNEAAEKAASGSETVSAASEEQLAATQEIAASSTSLASLAESLQRAIQQFKI